jgi:hypothetical protein
MFTSRTWLYTIPGKNKRFIYLLRRVRSCSTAHPASNSAGTWNCVPWSKVAAGWSWPLTSTQGRDQECMNLCDELQSALFICRLLVEVAWSHSGTPHSVGSLWTSDQPKAETSTWQNTTPTTDWHPCTGRVFFTMLHLFVSCTLLFWYVTWGRMLWIFPAGKIRRLRLGANPRTWVPEASMLNTRPPKPLSPSKRAAADPRLRPRDYWDQHIYIYIYIYI